MEDIMAESPVSKWPLDFDALEKGSVIDTEDLERILGHKRTTAKYQFGVMALKDRIRKELSMRGIDAFVIQTRNTLKVLTDEEGSAYGHTRWNRGIATQMRANEGMRKIDVAKIPEDRKSVV